MKSISKAKMKKMKDLLNKIHNDMKEIRKMEEETNKLLNDKVYHKAVKILNGELIGGKK